MTQTLDPAARQRRIIPVMLRACELPLRIRMMTYADFTQPEKSDLGLKRLLASTGIDAVSPSPTTSRRTFHTTDYDLRVLSELLMTAFDDESLTSLCYDHFPKVYDEFSAGRTKIQKIRMLIEYCERHQVLDHLLSIVRDLNPPQYSRFEHRLAGSETK